MEIINLKKVSDPVLSQKMMGEGFAVKPSNNGCGD
ncbi:PTS glucose transporter subunit IIA [Enterococcus thailandicus]|nr:PTS glucose transporter subunit IIA [Enterococcus thailandicus]MDA3965155.1 PTS glucose transporter subunit IIA [Enterococcus thailandicus]